MFIWTSFTFLTSAEEIWKNQLDTPPKQGFDIDLSSARYQESP
jgi:hypothetical protein